MSKAFHKQSYRKSTQLKGHRRPRKEHQRHMETLARATLTGLALSAVLEQQAARSERIMGLVGIYVAALTPRRR